MPVEQETIVVYAGTAEEGKYLADVPISRVLEFQNKFLAYVDSSAADVRSMLAEKKELSPEIETKLKQALSDFKSKAWK
jgi:F-type H+-transporting ATPase subunit alpha